MKSAFFCLMFLVTFSAHARLTIGTYNIRNFDYDDRSRIHTNTPQLSTYIRSLNFDLMGFNEVDNTQAFENMIHATLPNHETVLSRCGGAHGQHVAVVYNKNALQLLQASEMIEFSNPGGQTACDSGSRPAVVILFKEIATGQNFYHMQVHFKSGGNADSFSKRAKQYNLMQQTVRQLVAAGTPRVLVMGDMNTTGYLPRDQDYRNFVSAVAAAGLTDLSANIGCTAYWWGGSDDGIESPAILDHVLATPAMLANQPARATVGTHCQAVSCQAAPIAKLGISYAQVSDHCPQTATIR